MEKDDRIHGSIYFAPDRLPSLRTQFEGPFFDHDRRQLELDLEPIYRGCLAPTVFSWWCVNLPNAVTGGQYQASLETLATAWHMKRDSRVPARARELLLEQAGLQKWTDPGYGSDMGHDLASSHHCRGLAAGLDIVHTACHPAELRSIANAYAARVREPYLMACSGANPYLLGVRNTNWLAHLSGSVLLVELALARFGLQDRSMIALAKANVLRYIDAIRPNGSMPEQGDYFHYGMEAALLSLHAWAMHTGRDILRDYSQSGLSRALRWPLAVTDERGGFWADFGDTHTGAHEASRVVGYLMAEHLDEAGGQWLADTVRTREPLAPLLRLPGIQPIPFHPRVYLASGEELAAVNFPGQSLAFRGGPCRSRRSNIPHRHYDTGSLIYRVQDINVLADSGFDRYTDTYWSNFDDPAHVRSAARLHNVLLADDRGHQVEDGASGRILLCQEDLPGAALILWQLESDHPGIATWERQILVFEGGPLVIVDRAVSRSAHSLSLLWHLHEPATISGSGIWKNRLIQCQSQATAAITLRVGNDHPRPYLQIDAPVTPGRPVDFATIVTTASVPTASSPSRATIDWTRNVIRYASFCWHIDHRFLERI